jgi:hypothetical protein
METLTQRLRIPDNHQITLTLPPNIPSGEAEIVLVINLHTLEFSCSINRNTIATGDRGMNHGRLESPRRY